MTLDDKPAIEKWINDYFEGENKHDLDSIMTLFVPDIVNYGSCKPPVYESDSMRKMYKEGMKGIVSVEGSPKIIEFSESKDMAYCCVEYKVVREGKDKPVEYLGKYLAVLRKINDDWKCVVFSWTSNDS